MPIVVWDIDDVLNELTRDWLSWSAYSSFAFEDLTSPDVAGCLGITHDEYLASLDEFRRTRFAALVPNPRIKSWLRAADGVDSLALTATPLSTAPNSAVWVLNHFGEWLGGVLIAPSRRPHVRDHGMTKSKHLARFVRGGLEVLVVDDHMANIEAALEVGCTTFLWPRPWNTQTMSEDEVLCEVARYTRGDSGS